MRLWRIEHCLTVELSFIESLQTDRIMSILSVIKAVLTVDASVMTYCGAVTDCMKKTILLL